MKFIIRKMGNYVQPEKAGIAKPVSLKKENAVLHQKILTFIGKDVQDPDKKQDS